MYDQIYEKMKGILSDKICGYRKGFSTQHALTSMTKQWRESLENKDFAGTVESNDVKDGSNNAPRRSKRLKTNSIKTFTT